MSEDEKNKKDEKPKVCSACGSSAPHHVAYVEKNGVCVT